MAPVSTEDGRFVINMTKTVLPRVSYPITGNGSQHEDGGGQHGLNGGGQEGLHVPLQSSAVSVSPAISSSEAFIWLGKSCGKFAHICEVLGESSTNPVDRTHSSTGTIIFFSQFTQSAIIRFADISPFAFTVRSLPKLFVARRVSQPTLHISVNLGRKAVSNTDGMHISKKLVRSSGEAGTAMLTFAVTGKLTSLPKLSISMRSRVTIT